MAAVAEVPRAKLPEATPRRVLPIGLVEMVEPVAAEGEAMAL